VEVKNMNSFRSIEQAVQYEIERQSELLRGGEIPVQETRGWDENGRVTVSQRTKETAEDYRYFPEPDIPPLLITDEDIIEARQAMPEALSEFRSRMNELIASDLTEGLILDSSKREYILKLVEISGGRAGELLKFFYSEPLRGISKIGLPFNCTDPQEMLTFFNLALSGTVPKKVIKERTEEYLCSGLSAEQFFEQYKQSGEIDIPSVIEDIVAKNPNAVADYRKGKSNSVQFLVGQTLKTTKGFGDPGQIREQIVSHLELSK
jgi:aspartyl-tRNA(Asn)/glutamyl-tRNA(Gln) amidotransferase subunit B